MIPREQLNKIKTRFFQKKAIVILGPRQVGKTTLAHRLVDEAGKDALWLNGDEPDIREILANTSAKKLQLVAGNKKIIVIDEAQRIVNIGLTIKLLVDNFPHIQTIVTGSSALELANEINEPLTGRKYDFFLFPLSFSEMAGHTSFIEEHQLLESRLIYGYYPDIVTSPGMEKEILMNLASSYLYKDIFIWEQIKKPVVLEKLLQALALQLGSEVTFHELGQMVGADNATVERYIDLLEKAFVVFRLPSLSRNMRNEIKKGRKIYFYDNGIRNSIIKNFSPLNLRQDTGALWENFLIVERMKRNHYSGNWVNMFFWRTHSQQEIDYIEECDGKLHAFEFKWNPRKKARIVKSFLNAYPGSESMIITPNNFDQFILS